MTEPEEIKRRLAGVRLFLLDLDGTLYLGDQLFDCSVGFVKALRKAGKEVIFLTNNSSVDARAYAIKLTGLGIDATAQDVVTSGTATTGYLQKKYQGGRVFALGTESFERELRAAGFELVDDDSDVVVASFDLTLNYEKVRRACSEIGRGVPFIATHPDFVCPTPDGPIPDCGAICAMITAATGVSPHVLGKPACGFAEYAMKRVGATPQETAMVGDRLYTDVAMGLKCGMVSILVLSGETSLDMVIEPKPHIVVENVAGLMPFL